MNCLNPDVYDEQLSCTCCGENIDYGFLYESADEMEEIRKTVLCDTCGGGCKICGSISIAEEGHLHDEYGDITYSCFHDNLRLAPHREWAQQTIDEQKAIHA